MHQIYYKKVKEYIQNRKAKKLVIYRLGVLASAARAACVAELRRCVVVPTADVVTVEVSLFVTVSAARRRRSSSIDGCTYDSCASSDDVPPCVVVDEVVATS